MNQNNPINKPRNIDVAAFEKAVAQPSNSIESMVLKLRTSKFFTTLPDWIEQYYVPPGTLASTDPPAKCMAALVAVAHTKAFNVHPAYQMDMLVSSNDVVITNLGVSYKEADKVSSCGVNLGYLVPDMLDSRRVIHASTADIVCTDAKMDRAKNILPPEWPDNFGVPVTDSSKVRVATGVEVSSRSKSRDEIFNFLSLPDNSVFGIRFHSYVGEKLNNFVPSPPLTTALTRYYHAKKLQPPEGLAIRVIGTDNGSVAFTENIEMAYKYYFKSVSVRGGRDGKNVAHGFERFCMSRTISNTLNILQDFNNMARVYKSKTVLVKDSSYLTTEQIRVLVHNSFRIVLPNTCYPPCKEDSDPGMYSTYQPGMAIFEYMVLTDAMVKPEIINSSIQFGKHYDDALSKIAKTERCFALMYLDTRLEQYARTVSFYPSCTADTMQFIIATGCPVGYTVPNLVKRATMAISCRNRFIHARKSFSTMDIMGNFVCWDQKLYYPRLRIVEQKKGLDLSAMTVAETMDVIPLEVNLKELNAAVAHVEMQEMPARKMVVELIESDRDVLFKVMIGKFMYANPFKFVDRDRWHTRHDIVLSLTEAEFLAILNENPEKHYGVRYNAVAQEVIPAEEPVGIPDDPVVPRPADIRVGQDDVFNLDEFNVNLAFT